MRKQNINYYGTILEDSGGVIRVLCAYRLNTINQHKSKFVPVDSRNVARKLNKSKFVIK